MEIAKKPTGEQPEGKAEGVSGKSRKIKIERENNCFMINLVFNHKLLNLGKLNQKTSSEIVLNANILCPNGLQNHEFASKKASM